MEGLRSEILFYCFGCLVCVIFTIIEAVRFMNNRWNKKIRNELIGCIVASVLCFSFTTYCSLDLIKKDFVEDTGTFTHYSRRGYRYAIDTIAYFELKEAVTVGYEISKSDTEKLKQGESYLITYAKRTGKIIAITEIENTDVL